MSPWHADRMEGQAERFVRVARCGAETEGLQWLDTETGRTSPHHYACGHWRVCAACAKARKKKLQTGVVAQRALALAVYRQRLQRHYGGQEGRWSERLITVTLPHSGELHRDARALVAAWRDVEVPWRRHLRSRGLREPQVYVRAIEVANAKHVHMHVWVLGPYLEHSLLHAWWGSALEKQGYSVPRKPLSEVLEKARDSRTARWLASYASGGVPWPHVDVRGGLGGDGAAKYAAKVGAAMYAVKVGGQVERMSPEHAALVYEALEGTRVVQWAKGWAPPPRRSGRWLLRRVRGAEARAQVQREREKTPDAAPLAPIGAGMCDTAANSHAPP